MTIRRIGRAPIAVVPANAAPVAVVPQIAIKRKPSMVAQCPTDVGLVSEVMKRTPRIARLQRKDGYMHVSDLIGGMGKCVRKIAIAAKLGSPVRPTRLSIPDRIVYAIGDAVHDTVKKITSEGGPDMVWGLWKCSCGHLYHDEPCTLSQIDPDDICPLCSTPSNVYKEVSVFNEEYNIVGNPDLLLYVAEVNAFHVTELKSIAPEQFKELTRPKPEHILQVIFYWWLMLMAGYRLTDRVSIVYITKGYQFKGDVEKEYMINPEVELHRLLPYLDDALRAKMSKTENVFPIRKVCAGEFATIARKCEVVKQCFALCGT